MHIFEQKGSFVHLHLHHVYLNPLIFESVLQPEYEALGKESQKLWSCSVCQLQRWLPKSIHGLKFIGLCTPQNRVKFTINYSWGGGTVVRLWHDMNSGSDLKSNCSVKNEKHFTI